MAKNPKPPSLRISGLDTYTEWALVPTSRLVVAPPEVKTTYIDLPASHGVLDYTDLLLGEPPLGLRQGSWEFAIDHTRGLLWASVYESMIESLHGVEHTIVLSDDPTYQFKGRLFVNPWKSDQAYSKIVIDYKLEPKKESAEAFEDLDWEWDSIFSTEIRYSTFSVNNTKARNFINNGSASTTIAFTCSAPMEVEYNGETYSLVTGLNKNSNLDLQVGDNIMRFNGSGTVAVSYREAAI